MSDLVLTPEVDFSDRERITMIMDGAIELFGESVTRDGTDLYLHDKPWLNTIATMMTDVRTGKIVIVVRAEG